MVSELSTILDKFPGAANQMHCFAHTVSISAKAILKQCDIPKKKEDEVLDKAAQALSDMAQELELEERIEQETQDRKDTEEDDWMLDAWVDFREGLTEAEVMALDVSVQHVRSMLVKVRLVVLTLTIL